MRSLVILVALLRNLEVDLFAKLACSILVELFIFTAKRRPFMHAHYKLAWVEHSELNTLIHQVILSLQIQLVEIVVLLQLLQYDLLLGELALNIP